MHAHPWAQESMNLTVHNEAERVIEVQSVGVRRDRNDLGAGHRSDRSRVMDELAADSVSHPRGVNEEILEIEDALSHDDGRETHDGVGVDRDSSPPFGDAVPFQNQRGRVGEESFAITVIGQ